MIAFRVFTRVAGLGSTLVLARLLMPADFGLLAMATTFAAAIEGLSALGIQDALVRDPEKNRDLYDTAFTIQAGRAVLTGGIVALGTPWAARWFAEPRLVPVLLVLAGLSALSGFENIGIIEFRRDLHFGMQVRLLVLPRLLQIGATILAAWTLHSYWALLIGTAAGRLSQLAMTYVVHPYRPSLAIGRWRDLVGFTFWTWATAIVGLAWNRADPFILGPMVGPMALGMYLQAGALAMLPLTEFLVPATEALFPGFAAAQVQGTDPMQMAPKIAVALVMVLAPVAIVLSAAAGDVVMVLLGGQWAAATVPMAIFAATAIFAPIGFVCNTALVARGRVRANFIPIAVMMLPKVIVIWLAARTGSLAIVAAANVALLAIETSLFVIILHQQGVRLAEAAKGMLRGIVAIVATMGLLYETGLGWQLGTRPVLAAFLHGLGIGVLVCAIYGALLMLLWLVSGRPAGPEAFGIGLLRQVIGARKKPALHSPGT
jgi:O-antigen/teichoic acid export membrane protein